MLSGCFSNVICTSSIVLKRQEYIEGESTKEGGVLNRLGVSLKESHTIATMPQNSSFSFYSFASFKIGLELIR